MTRLRLQRAGRLEWTDVQRRWADDFPAFRVIQTVSDAELQQRRLSLNACDGVHGSEDADGDADDPQRECR
jgi:hypothetical protein